jgi:ubiquinone/menaquinone biosynthesis C-methylase UbiE
MKEFNAKYDGIPPWDIGRPQEAIRELEESGEINGTVLDLGCGTGENALYLAEKGHEVWGLDFSETAISRAMAKAKERDVNVRFLKGDALKLENLDRQFDVIIDSGLFHTFEDDERITFIDSLKKALKTDGYYYMLCFSDHETSEIGPRRITQTEVRMTST